MKLFDEAMAFDVMKYPAQKYDAGRKNGRNVRVVEISKSSKNQ